MGGAPDEVFAELLKIGGAHLVAAEVAVPGIGELLGLLVPNMDSRGGRWYLALAG